MAESAKNNKSRIWEAANGAYSKYAFNTYCCIIRWVLKNEPLSAMACRMTSPNPLRSP